MKIKALILTISLSVFVGLSFGFEGGSGIESDPYQISTCQQLQNMQNDLSAYYELINNIDCSDTENWNSGQGFNPIGDNSSSFTGNLNGNNYEVIELFVNRPTENAIGLIGFATNAEVSNINIFNSDIVGKGHYSFGGVGVLFGKMEEGTIENVGVSGSLQGRGYVGGLIGSAWDSNGVYVESITSSINLNQASGGRGRLGGIIGGSNQAIINNSVFEGSISGNGNRTGGIIGNAVDSEIVNSTSDMNVSGSHRIGGIVGNLAGSSKLSSSSARGKVFGDYMVGGAVGLVGNNAVISNSKAYSIVSGGDATGGLIGYSDNDVHSSSAYGSVSGNNGVGGLVGQILFSDITVTESSAVVNVSGNEDVGGLIGAIDASRSGVNRSYSAGKVVGSDNVGGLVGLTVGGYFDNQVFIDNSFSVANTRSIDDGGLSLSAGLVGRLQRTNLSNSYSAGRNEGPDTGGLTASSSSSNIVDAYWDINSSGQSTSDGGENLTTVQMIGAAAGSNMAGFDFQDTWSTQSFYYPRLQWMEIGSGSESDPFIIYNCRELQALDNDLLAHYELANDIDCSDTVNWNFDAPGGQGFVPLGTSRLSNSSIGINDADAFEGSIDGSGFDIKGLNMNWTGVYVGLIGYLGSSGSVENISVINSYLETNDGEDIGRQIGVLAGESRGIIQNVNISSSEVYGSSRVGGVTGVLRSGTVYRSYFSGNLGGGFRTGGIAGWKWMKSSLIDESYTDVNITGSSAVGGLVGEHDPFGIGDLEIRDSYSTGSIYAEDSIGGLIGEIEEDTSYSKSTVKRTFANAEVSGNQDKGGLIGLSKGGLLYDSYWDEESSNITISDGGSSLSSSQMQGCNAEQNLQGFDFENTWIAQSNDYPALRFFTSTGLSCDASIPQAPTLLLPLDDSTQVPVKTNLSVTAEGTGLQNITFYRNNSGSDTEIGTVTDVNASNSEVAQFEWSGLNTTTEYDWYAVAENSDGSVTSDTWSFTTEKAPVIDSFEPAHGSNTEPNPELKINVSDDISNDIEVRFYDSSDQLLETASGLSSGGQAIYDPALDSFASNPGQSYEWYAVVETDSGALINSSESPSFASYWNFTTQNLISASIDVKFGDQVNMNNGSADIGRTDLRFEPWNPSGAVMDNVIVNVDGVQVENFNDVPSNTTKNIAVSSLGLSEDQTYSWSISVEDSGTEVGSFNGEFTTHTVDIEAVPQDDSHDSINLYYSEDGVAFSELKSFSRSDNSPLSVRAANPELYRSGSNHCYTAATSNLGLESSQSPEVCIGGSIP